MMVKIYMIILYGFVLVLSFFLDGKPLHHLNPNVSFKEAVGGFLLFLPIFGRVMEWW